MTKGMSSAEAQLEQRVVRSGAVVQDRAVGQQYLQKLVALDAPA